MTRPPECDAACRAKILLNAGRVKGEISSGVELSGHLAKHGMFSATEGQQFINMLDELEDKIIEFNNRLLAKTGYKRKTTKFKLEELE
jgi:hypothetical protein